MASGSITITYYRPFSGISNLTWITYGGIRKANIFLCTLFIINGIIFILNAVMFIQRDILNGYTGNNKRSSILNFRNAGVLFTPVLIVLFYISISFFAYACKYYSLDAYYYSLLLRYAGYFYRMTRFFINPNVAIVLNITGILLSCISILTFTRRISYRI
jgi:hypothetical protein